MRNLRSLRNLIITLIVPVVIAIPAAAIADTFTLLSTSQVFDGIDDNVRHNNIDIQHIFSDSYTLSFDMNANSNQLTDIAAIFDNDVLSVAYRQSDNELSAFVSIGFGIVFAATTITPDELHSIDINVIESKLNGVTLEIFVSGKKVAFANSNNTTLSTSSADPCTGSLTSNESYFKGNIGPITLKG